MMDDTNSAESRRKKARKRNKGGSTERRRKRLYGPIIYKPSAVRHLPTYEILDVDGVERIDDAAVTLLEQYGIEFRDQESLALWRGAGAEISEQRVRIPRELLRKLISTVPEHFEYCSRNPDRNVTVGGPNMIFGPAYGTPNVIDLNGSRRPATLNDLVEIIKIHQTNPAIHYNGGYTVEPLDVAIPYRHLEMVRAGFRYTDKPIMGSPLSQTAAEDSLAMARLVFGDEMVDQNVVMTAIFNCNSPLVWDNTMLAAMRVYAAANQALLCSPFVLYGASTPVHILAATAQMIAEALAGVAFTQIVRPGCRAVMGVAPMGVYMKSGSPTFGSPEVALTMYVFGQMARYYKIPWRTNGAKSGSKCNDLYAGYDSILKVYPAILGGCNLLTHCGGTLESSLCISYAKIATDAAQLDSFYTLLQGVTFDDFELALQSLKEVGPAGNFFADPYTLAHLPFLDETQDNERYETWIATGAKDATARGIEWIKRSLQRYENEPPVLNQSLDNALDDFVERRKHEIRER